MAFFAASSFEARWTTCKGALLRARVRFNKKIQMLVSIIIIILIIVAEMAILYGWSSGFEAFGLGLGLLAFGFWVSFEVWCWGLGLGLESGFCLYVAGRRV